MNGCLKTYTTPIINNILNVIANGTTGNFKAVNAYHSKPIKATTIKADNKPSMILNFRV